MTLLLPHHKIIPASEVSRKTIFQEVFSRRNYISIAIVLFVCVSECQIRYHLLSAKVSLQKKSLEFSQLVSDPTPLKLGNYFIFF